jgi:hypothetical protein
LSGLGHAGEQGGEIDDVACERAILFVHLSVREANPNFKLHARYRR